MEKRTGRRREGGDDNIKLSDVTYNESLKKAIPITGRGGVYGCEMLRIPHCLDNRLYGCQAYAPAAVYSPETLILVSVRD
jgi:hypothetical protein